MEKIKEIVISKKDIKEWLELIDLIKDLSVEKISKVLNTKN